MPFTLCVVDNKHHNNNNNCLTFRILLCFHANSGFELCSFIKMCVVIYLIILYHGIVLVNFVHCDIFLTVKLSRLIDYQ